MGEAHMSWKEEEDLWLQRDQDTTGSPPPLLPGRMGFVPRVGGQRVPHALSTLPWQEPGEMAGLQMGQAMGCELDEEHGW